MNRVGMRGNTHLFRCGISVCLLGLLWSFLAFPLHLMIAHSHDTATDPCVCSDRHENKPESMESVFPLQSKHHHNADTCSICQAFSVIRDGGCVPSNVALHHYCPHTLQRASAVQDPLLDPLITSGFTRAPPASC